MSGDRRGVRLGAGLLRDAEVTTGATNWWGSASRTSFPRRYRTPVGSRRRPSGARPPAVDLVRRIDEARPLTELPGVVHSSDGKSSDPSRDDPRTRGSRRWLRAGGPPSPRRWGRGRTSVAAGSDTPARPSVAPRSAGVSLVSYRRLTPWAAAPHRCDPASRNGGSRRHRPSMCGRTRSRWRERSGRSVADRPFSRPECRKRSKSAEPFASTDVHARGRPECNPLPVRVRGCAGRRRRISSTTTAAVLPCPRDTAPSPESTRADGRASPVRNAARTSDRPCTQAVLAVSVRGQERSRAWQDGSRSLISREKP